MNEWCFKIGQIVYADLDEVYSLPNNRRFEIVIRTREGNEQYFVLKDLKTNELYDANASMIS